MPKNMINQRIFSEGIAQITTEKANELQKYRLLVGDVIFGRRGDIGRCALVTKQEEDWICGTGCLRARLRKDVSPEYIIYYLAMHHVIYWLQSNAVGQTMLNLNTSILAALPIVLPPLPEQHKIAEILGAWDEAITLTERLIAAKQQRKKALMQQLLTGKVRFGGFEGRKETVLGEVATIIMGQSPPSSCYNTEEEGLPLIQGNADIQNRKSNPRVFTTKLTKCCYVGDLILSVRAPVGEVAKSLHKACIGRGVCAIRATNIDTEFLYQKLLYLESRWGKFAQGSTFTAINSKDIKHFRLRIPQSLEEQVKVGAILRLCDDEITLLQQKAAALRQQKKGLMQQLLTGKVRVKGGSMVNGQYHIYSFLA